MSIDLIPPRHLLPEAVYQRDWRKEKYPAAVKGGRMTAEEAEADWHAWIAISQWLAGEPMEQLGWDVTWAELELAAAKALQWGEQAAAARPADTAVAARRDAVAEILTALQRMRSFIDTLNADLRRHAARQSDSVAA